MAPSNASIVKRLLVVAAIVAGVHAFYSIDTGRPVPRSAHTTGGAVGSTSAVDTAFADHASDVQVSGQGVVARVLADDVTGARHQRFIVRLPSGLTLLIAHNIDLAPRIGSLRSGDVVRFSGVYEWNEKGGIVHWTHRDPRGEHAAGWIRHRGRIYQ